MMRVFRVGNIFAVEVPEELLSATGLEPGDSVEWVVSESGNLSLVPGLMATSDSALSREVALAGDETEILAHIHAGLADFDAGRSVSHEKVVGWLDSWGTEHELPTPECD